MPLRRFYSDLFNYERGPGSRPAHDVGRPLLDHPEGSVQKDRDVHGWLHLLRPGGSPPTHSSFAQKRYGCRRLHRSAPTHCSFSQDDDHELFFLLAPRGGGGSRPCALLPLCLRCFRVPTNALGDKSGASFTAERGPEGHVCQQEEEEICSGARKKNRCLQDQKERKEIDTSKGSD